VTLSANSCPTIRGWLAPNAERTANSRRRVVARESSKLATLAQTSSKTKVTAPSSANAVGFSCCALMSFQVCALSCQSSYTGNSLR
jgi:hypothetical protein